MGNAKIDPPDPMLWAHVTEWLNARLRHDLANETLDTDQARIAYLTNNIADLAAALIQHRTPAQEITTPTTAFLVLALVALKPPQATIETCGAVWHALQQQIARSATPPEPVHIFGLVLAYGCGWSRIPTRDADTWDGRWTYAIVALAELVAGAWRYTLRQLEDTLPAGTFGSEAFTKTEIASIAADITLDLLHNRGARTEHHLTAWEPTRSSLVHFIYDAVAGCRYRPTITAASAAQKGPSFPRLQGGAFRNSMGLRLLQEDIGLMVGRVEFQVCPHCHNDLIQNAVAKQTRIILSNVTSLLEANQQCPTCQKRVPHASIPYRIARNNWIFVPYDRGGHYIQVARWRCGKCGTLYPADLAIREQMLVIETTIKELYHTKTRQRAFEHLLHLPEIQSLCQQQRLTPGILLDALKHRLSDLRAHDAQVARCPLCHGDPPQRPSMIWCRTSGVQLDNRV